MRCDEGNAADDQKPKPDKFLGGYAEGVTPVPIPNTEVKPLRADGTARVAVWESRSPPGIINRKAPSFERVMGLFCAGYKTIFKNIALTD